MNEETIFKVGDIVLCTNLDCKNGGETEENIIIGNEYVVKEIFNKHLLIFEGQSHPDWKWYSSCFKKVSDIQERDTETKRLKQKETLAFLKVLREHERMIEL